MSVIDALNDNCFVLAQEGIGHLFEAFEEEVGRPPATDELAELLTWGLRELRGDFSDAVLTIKTGRKQKKRKLEVGDLFGVVEGDRCHVVVFLGRQGRFGSAFGICVGKYLRRPLAADWRPPSVYAYPVFTEEDAAESGHWRWLGRNPESVALFRDPAFYHSPRHHPGEPRYGEHGLLEPHHGEIRQLTEDEARDVGLLDECYRFSYPWKDFEDIVRRRAAFSGKDRSPP